MNPFIFLSLWPRETWVVALEASAVASFISMLIAGFTGVKTKRSERVWIIFFVTSAILGTVSILALFPPSLGYQPGIRGALKEFWSGIKPMLIMMLYFYVSAFGTVIGAILGKRIRRA